VKSKGIIAEFPVTKQNNIIKKKMILIQMEIPIYFSATISLDRQDII